MGEAAHPSVAARVRLAALVTAVVLSLVLALISAASNFSSNREAAAENRRRIDRLEQESVTRMEMADVKARLSRIEDKLDRILERQSDPPPKIRQNHRR